MTQRGNFDIFVSGGEVALPPLAQADEAARWHEITGGRLGSQRLLVRLARDANGALSCTGLVVGLDGEDVTSTTLRDVPLGAITRSISRQLALKPGSRRWVDRVSPVLQELLGASLAPAPRRSPRRRRRGGPGPSDGDLADFMRALYLAGGQGKRGAMTRTAVNMNMDRSTAYRWLALAEERGITADKGQA